METIPEPCNGLTDAEIHILSLDHINQDDRIASELSRFYGIHIEALENFEIEFKTYRGLEQKHTARQVSYDNLHTWSLGKGERKPQEGKPFTPDEIIIAAVRHAGTAVMKSNQELKAEKEKLLEHGSEISVALRDYLVSRLPNLNNVIINGTKYGLKHEVMTCEKENSIVTFAVGELFTTIARRVYGNTGEIVAKHPNLEEWRKLFKDVELVAKF